MSQYYESILIGIIGGVLATTFILFIQVIWLKIIRPLIEEFLYRDLYIDGEWIVEADFNDGDNRKRNLHFRQKAHRISGTLVATSGLDEGAAYDLEGVFKNLILTLTYTSTAKSSIDRGTITLIVKEDGRRLEGISSYYSTQFNGIRYCKYVCTRKEFAVMANKPINTEGK